MKQLNEKLNSMRKRLRQRHARIMIIGLGSVGNYLLNYLMSDADESMDICVVGRNAAKMQSDVNIIRTASMIRRQNKSRICVNSDVDLEDISSLTSVVRDFEPDVIVNSSRAYPGLKYGSISWKHIRAYGIWAPLAIHFTKNIMEACEQAGSDAVVINTSYSDAVIPWLKTAGHAYPDFGSGNLNHLIPRIKFAVAETVNITDYWNIDVTLATSHFHDVVISKEGHSEGVRMLMDIRYQGNRVDVDFDKIFSKCCIAMPDNAKRNMMNASSNYEMIRAILDAVRKGSRTKLHCPGVFGEMGGYPVVVDGTGNKVEACFFEDYFSLEQMRAKNQESMYLDGIESIKDGTLTYTDELLDKVREAFGVSLFKSVSFHEIDQAAGFIIKEIIETNIQKRGV